MFYKLLPKILETEAEFIEAIELSLDWGLDRPSRDYALGEDLEKRPQEMTESDLFIAIERAVKRRRFRWAQFYIEEQQRRAWRLFSPKLAGGEPEETTSRL